MDAHPPADLLEAFGLGRGDENSAEAVRAHLEGCADCRRKVAALSDDAFAAGLRRAQAPDGTPAPAGALDETSHGPAPRAAPPAVPPELASDEQYEVLRELGRGGMGVVYLARNRLMDRLEVLKVVKSALLDRPQARERFLREIRAAARLSHPNVVAAYSASQRGELLVLAMEYVEGEDLARRVRAAGPLPVAEACDYVRQAALGLQHAFEQGMVHRDIKPQNLLLARRGGTDVVKVLDFGLAKATREKADDGGLTGRGAMLGTPDYIAPEQSLDAARADIRADVYSLGCTLYFLLTGGPPFRAANLFEIVQAHHSAEAKPLDAVRPDVPAGLAAVVRKMMAKEPAARYPTPAAVAEALRPFAEPAAAPRPVRRKRLLGAAAALGVLLAVLAGLWAAGVLRVRTADGVLVVEVNESEPELFVDGDRVTVSWDDGGRRAEVRVPPGTRRVEVRKDGFVVEGRELTVREGRRELFTARLVPAAKAAEPGPKSPAKAGKRFPCEVTRWQGSEWRVEGDELVQASVKGKGLLVFGDPAWADYDYAAEVKWARGGDAVGLVFRFVNNDDAYCFSVAGFGNTWHMITASDHGRYVYPQPTAWPATLPREGWHRLEVRVRGDRGRCLIDGKDEHRFKADLHRKGRVGLTTWDTAYRFRRIVVKDSDGAVLLEGLPDVENAKSSAAD